MMGLGLRCLVCFLGMFKVGAPMSVLLAGVSSQAKLGLCLDLGVVHGVPLRSLLGLLCVSENSGWVIFCLRFFNVLFVKGSGEKPFLIQVACAKFLLFTISFADIS